jgi:hypothetical protein
LGLGYDKPQIVLLLAYSSIIKYGGSMHKRHLSSFSLLLLFMFIVFSCKKETASSKDSTALSSQKTLKSKDAPASMTVFATGLNNPRGLKFGPDGNLYVAEAGTGGTQSTAGLCPQAPPPMGPYLGSNNGGRVSRIDMWGNRTTVSDKLPSSQSASNPPEINGPADVAFVNNQLYVLLDGAGCLHGVTSLPNGIVRIGNNGTPSLVANLGDWLLAHPPANPSTDFDPTGVWYSMVARGDDLYALNANQGTFVKVGLDGSIQLISDMSATVGHIVPTALTERGNFYMGNLGIFPIQGNSAVYKMTPSGIVKEMVSGFSAVLGLVIDQQSRMYVLEMTVGHPFPTPGTGRITRVEPNGDKQVIVSGLSFPTAMTMGPDGNLYVSNWGFGKPPGGGEIVKVTLQ